MAVIRHLEGTRLYVTASRIEEEFDRLMDRAQRAFLEAHELGVDVTKSVVGVKIRVRDAGTGETTERATSAWSQHLGAVLTKLPKGERAEFRKRAVALAREYDRFNGHARQLRGPMMQLLALVRAGKLDRDEELPIRTRYAKLSNRRFQARDFWFSEVSGKSATEMFVPGGGVYHFEDEDGNETEVEVDRVASRRGRLFRVAASLPEGEHEWITEDIQDLVGVDVSGSQIQIYAVLLGLRKLENELRHNPAKTIFAWRAWQRSRDPRDPFELPDDYTGPDDERLQSAMKQAVLEAMYDAKPALIAERLEDEGHGLGTAANLNQFLVDRELGLDVIVKRWKPAMRKIAAQAYKADPYKGITFTDPFDGATVRWNPIKWEIPDDRRVAGTGDVRISAKVPVDPTRNEAGELAVWKQKIASTVGPAFIHMLDSMFCGLVVEELVARGAHDVVAVHDAWYVAADVASELRDAIRTASMKWFERLGAVYDGLERLLGTCTPPKRGKNKGRCCGRCANWIKELRAAWQARVDAGDDWPDFNVGDASPVTYR
jgi:DNA-dependent RNA polymerase